MKNTLRILGSILLLSTLTLAGYAGWILYPHEDPLPLPSPLVSLYSTEGKALLESAEVRADYDHLSKTFQAQSLASYCGVASSVAVLKAMGKNASQGDFFSDDASRLSSQLSVMFQGMTLQQLGGFLEDHGVRTSVHHADEVSIDQFRSDVENNLANADDYLLVNYQRKSLGQDNVGHISPLAAYNRKSDSVLIMDTTSNNYPPTWVPVKMLFAAMMTTDSTSGKMRGYVDVTK